MMDWTNASQVMQAIYWTVLFALFVNGYTVGSRSAL